MYTNQNSQRLGGDMHVLDLVVFINLCGNCTKCQVSSETLSVKIPSVVCTDLRWPRGKIADKSVCVFFGGGLWRL